MISASVLPGKKHKTNAVIGTKNSFYLGVIVKVIYFLENKWGIRRASQRKIPKPILWPPVILSEMHETERAIWYIS